MKKTRTSLLLALAWAATNQVFAQAGLWNLNGPAAATTTSAFVGIGTTNPGSPLHIDQNFFSQPLAPAPTTPIFHINFTPPGGQAQENFYVTYEGKVGIGTAVPDEKLHIKDGSFVMHNGSFTLFNAGVPQFKVDPTGYVWARQVKVLAGPIPDYVFAPGYKLMGLMELEQYIKLHSHLPGVPAAAEFTDGVDIGEMQLKLLEKVEELTLYIITQQKKIDILELEVKRLKN